MTLEAVEKWWHDVQSKGVKEALVMALSSGDSDPKQLFIELKDMDAELVQTALIKGAQNAKAQWIVRHYIEQLAALKSKAATDQLLAMMKANDEVGIRLAAAKELFRQDHPAALLAVLRDMQTFPLTQIDRMSREIDSALYILIASGKPEAMREVVKNWDRRNVTDRSEIIWEIGKWMRKAQTEPERESDARPMENEARSLAMALLGHALDDTDVRGGSTFTPDNSNDPRVCDFALWALHSIEPKTYAFTVKETRGERDIERANAANTLRRERGEPEIPVPDIRLPRLRIREALRIVRVNVIPNSARPTLELSEKIAALKGTDFTPETLPTLLRWFANNESPGVRGMRLEAVREADLTGVQLAVRLIPGAYPRSGAWAFAPSGHFGELPMWTSGEMWPIPNVQKLWPWYGFTNNIMEGLKAPPTTEFVVNAGLAGPR